MAFRSRERDRTNEQKGQVWTDGADETVVRARFWGWWMMLGYAHAEGP